jgi:hypothetical protein
MAQIIIKGLIAEEDVQKYDGTATSFTRANSTGGTSTLTPVGAGSSGLKFTKVLASAVVSLSTNVATTGFIRLSNTDVVAFRNNPNNGQIGLSISGAAGGNSPQDYLTVSDPSHGFGGPYFTENSQLSAVAGVFRMTSGGKVSWRNNANGADLSISKDTSDNLTWPNPLLLKRLRANQGTAYSGVDAAIVPNAANGAGGWGIGAAVSAAAGYDQAFSFTVTAAGTPGASPTIVVTFKDGTWTSAPQFIVKRNDVTAPVSAGPDLFWVATATTLTITFVGTPVAASTYKFVCMAMGN